MAATAAVSLLTGPRLAVPLLAQVPGPSLHPALFTAPPADAVQWAHYVLVPQCIVAAWRLSHTEQAAEVRRRRGVPLPPDSLVLAYMGGVPRDTTPTAAAAHLRGCRARFSPARADSFDLIDLMTLAPAARDYPLADSALRRRLATLPTQSDRAHGAIARDALLTVDASGDSVGGYPEQLELLRRNERILTEHWPRAIAARLQLLTDIRQALVMKRLNLDSFTDTTPVSQAALDSLLLVPRLALLDSAPSEPYTSDEKAYVFAPAEQGIAVTPWLLPHVRLLEHAPRASAAALDSLLRFYQLDTTGLGRPLPPIAGQTWLRAETQGGRAVPVQPGMSVGRPTFVVLAGSNLNPSVTAVDLPILLQIRRLQEAIPALDLVVVVPARGLRYPSVRDTAAFGLADSTQELESIRRFYFDELRLRGTLVVEPMPWYRYPEPDRRWRGQSTATRQRFVEAHLAEPDVGGVYPTSWFLLDATGRVVLNTRSGLPPHRVLATAIRRFAVLASGGATRPAAAPVSP